MTPIKAETLVFFEIGAGQNLTLFGSQPWPHEHQNPVGGFARLAVTHEIGRPILGAQPYLFGHWSHVSQWDIGRPFGSNSDREQTLDHIGVGVGLILWRSIR